MVIVLIAALIPSWLVFSNRVCRHCSPPISQYFLDFVFPTLFMSSFVWLLVICVSTGPDILIVSIITYGLHCSSFLGLITL